MSDNYNPERLNSEIRKAEQLGCTVVAYDTLKAYQSAEWGDLYNAATALTERIKSSSHGLHGIFTFQLTDSVNQIPPEKLGSEQIAMAKNILHVADNMIMFQQLPSQKNSLYQAEKNGVTAKLPDSKKIAVFKIIKNRRGGGKNVLYGVQNNLDINCWEYISELTPVWNSAS